MGVSHCRNLDSRNSDNEANTKQEDDYEDAKETPSPFHCRQPKTPISLDDVDLKLQSLKLKYESRNPNPVVENPVSLYVHIGGNNPNARWVTSKKLTSYAFLKSTKAELENDDIDEDEENERSKENSFWILKVGSKIRVRVSAEMQMKSVAHHFRVDFVASDVWAMKFPDGDGHKGNSSESRCSH